MYEYVVIKEKILFFFFLSYWAYLALRFINGFGMGFMIVLPALANELVTANKRGIVTVILSIGWAIGKNVNNRDS